MIYLQVSPETIREGMTDEELARLLGIPIGPPASFSVMGNLTVDIWDAQGRHLQRSRVKNKIPIGGRNILRDLLARGVPGSGVGFAPTNMALGTGTTAAADNDTGLETEVYRDKFTSRMAKSAQVDFQLFLTTADANGNTITEAAMFDSPVTDGGRMLCRALLGTPIVKTSSIQATLTWTHTIASS